MKQNEYGIVENRVELFKVILVNFGEKKKKRQFGTEKKEIMCGKTIKITLLGC